jgi:hypothetical protein
VLAGLGVAAVALGAFVWRERRVGERGLIPTSVVRIRPFVFACMAVLAMSAVFFSALFYLPQFFQKILDEGILTSGLMLLPLVGMLAAASFTESWLVGRIGIKAVLTVGAGCIFLGPLLLAVLLVPTATWADVVPGMVVLGVGVGLFYSSITTAALGALPPERSSLAGGLLYMFQIAGGSLGLALATMVFLSTSTAEIDDAATAAGVSLTSNELVDVQGVLVGTETSQQLLAAYPAQASQLTEIVRDAFVDSMRWAFVFCAVLCAIGFAITALYVGGPLSRFGRDRAK